MTIKERLRIIGQAVTGKQTVKVVEKIEKAKEKIYAGTFLDFLTGGLSGETRVSSKVLEANTGWVYRNNDVIAKEVSTIEFELFSTRVVGGEIVYNKIETHPILDALDRFNEYTSSADGFYTTQSHKKLSGDAFWLIDGVGMNVQGIYILPPDKVTIVPGDENGQAIVKEYVYETTIEGKMVKQTYQPEEVIHFKVPHPNRQLRGLGVVEALAADIDLDTMAIKASQKLYERGMINNFLLTTDKNLTPEQVTLLRTQLTATYGGLDNAFKVPVVSGGLKPESLQLTNKELEFVAHQQWIRDKITSGFGNSKAVIGVTDDVNRANAEATINNWKRTTIRSEMKQITDTLNEFFVPRFGVNLIIGFKDLVEEDYSEKIDSVKKMIEANIITPNEAREMLGYDPLPEGNELRQSLNIPLIPKSLQHINLKAVLRRSTVYKDMELYQSIKSVTDKIAQKKIQSKKTKTCSCGHDHKDLQEYSPNIKAYYDKQIALVDVYEKLFESRVTQFIDKIVENALKNVPNEVADMQQKQLIDEEDLLVSAQIDFNPILAELGVAAGNEALKLVNVDKPYVIGGLRERIATRVNLFTASLIDTDRNILIDLIAAGVKEGQSIPDIKRNITEKFSTYTKSQAERITRTEVIKVSNQAALEAWELSDVVEGKEWLCSPGACEICQPYCGKTVMNLKGNFYSPDTEFEDGDPPIHPNCRCVPIPIVEGAEKAQAKRLAEDNANLQAKIKDLETKIDKRTKAFKEIKQTSTDDKAYIKALEAHLGVGDGQEE